MDSGFSEFRARQIVQKLHGLRSQIDTLGKHARTLSMCSANLDGLILLQSASRTMSGIMDGIDEFRSLEGQITSLKRSLASTAATPGVMPPAAQWGNEFRALSKQLIASVRNAEHQLAKLQAAADLKMKDPFRTASPVEGPIDVLQNLASILALLIEYLRRPKPST